MTTPWEGLREYSWPQVLCSAWLIGFTGTGSHKDRKQMLGEQLFISGEERQHFKQTFDQTFHHTACVCPCRLFRSSVHLLSPSQNICLSFSWHRLRTRNLFFLFSFSVLFGVLATHCPDLLPLWIIFRSCALIKASVIWWGMFYIRWITLAFWFLSSGLFANLLVGKSLSSSILPCAGSSSAFLSFSVVSSTQFSYFLIFIQ